MNLGQVADLCIRSHPEWDRRNTIAALGEWQRKHQATMEDTEAMAIDAMANSELRTPAALGWQPAPAPVDQPALAGLTIERPEDAPQVDNDCEHGVNRWAVTKSGEPQCPFCRGITRAKRNRFVPGFRMAGHRPCEQDGVEPEGEPVHVEYAPVGTDEPALSHD